MKTEQIKDEMQKDEHPDDHEPSFARRTKNPRQMGFGERLALGNSYANPYENDLYH